MRHAIEGDTLANAFIRARDEEASCVSAVVRAAELYADNPTTEAGVAVRRCVFRLRAAIAEVEKLKRQVDQRITTKE